MAIQIFRASISPWRLKVSGQFTPQLSAFTPNIYNKMFWVADFIDEGGKLVNGYWIPQRGPVIMSAHVWISSGAVHATENVVCKIFKNDVQNEEHEIATGIGTWRTNPPGSYVAIIPAWYDRASGSDTYTVKILTKTGKTKVDSNPAHTWFAGMAFGE